MVKVYENECIQLAVTENDKTNTRKQIVVKLRNSEINGNVIKGTQTTSLLSETHIKKARMKIKPKHCDHRTIEDKPIPGILFLHLFSKFRAPPTPINSARGGGGGHQSRGSPKPSDPKFGGGGVSCLS